MVFVPKEMDHVLEWVAVGFLAYGRDMARCASKEIDYGYVVGGF